MPEGAGPGTGEPLCLQVAAVDQLEQGQQLTTEEGLAAAGTGQRGQRLQQRALAEHTAVVALHAPDRDDGGRIDAVLGRHPIKQGPMLLQQDAPIVHALAIDQRGQVVPDRRGEFRLRVEQAEHAGIGGEPGDNPIEAVGTDALAGGCRLQDGQAAAESGIAAGRRRCCRSGCRGEHGRQAERGQNGHGVLRVAVAGPS